MQQSRGSAIPKYMGEIIAEQGTAAPLGASKKGHGVNFALAAPHATSVTLCLFSPGEHHPFLEVPLDPKKHRTKAIWHVFLHDLPAEELEYGYRISGPKDPNHAYHPELVLSDPYAKALASPHDWGVWEDLNGLPPRSRLLVLPTFDWEGVGPPRIPLEDLIIYEAHVRGFTMHMSSGVKNKGTFAGMIEKIPYLKKLGINAIELLPIFEFNECENPNVNPKTGEPLMNYWGYSTINFFCATPRYAAAKDWYGTVTEFRQLVKELHRNGIEVILDVVYNHTAEGAEKGPIYNFKGIDNDIYYILDAKGKYHNFAGTGNTFNANNPIVQQLILDSLRFWVTEMHVDGFRFDLASCLTRDETGEPSPEPPLIKAISEDKVFKDVKLIAEAWDAAGLYQVGTFPAYDIWAEWNGRYRDVVRRFVKGTDGSAGPFATALCGSQDLYGDRVPYHSINFVTAHDGFTLRDLVSYQEKHNEENGEENRDGMNENESWNCGVEGVTSQHKVLELRDRQMRNFATALFLSLGVPMLLMGDEYGHTRLGNNNTYPQDNALNWFLWDELERSAHFFHFCRQLIHFRKRMPLLKRRAFLTTDEVEWHGTAPYTPNWNPESRFVAYVLKDHDPLYIAFSANFEPIHILLPHPPQGKEWYRIIDTSLPSPEDFIEHPLEHPHLKSHVHMKEHSCFVAQAY